MIRARKAVWLVSRREVKTRLRTRAFRLVLALSAVAFVAAPLLVQLVNRGPETPKVAVTDAGFGRTLKAAAGQLHQEISVRDVGSASTADRQVRAGEIDAYAEPDDQGIEVTVDKSLPDDLRALFSVVQQRSVFDRQVVTLGGDPRKVAEAVGAVHLQVHAQQKPDPRQGQKSAVAVVAGLLMYMILMTVGQMVAQGVVEEKSSRVVELLLSAVKPWQLMAGKILGIGLLGLLQLLVPGVLGLAVAIGIGELDLSLGSAIGALGWSLVWFVAGFALYAMVFAALGAMVSRQEDLNGLMVPVMMPLIVGWIVGVSVLPNDPGSRLAAALSYVPPLAPVLMPMRWALGSAAWWELLVALAITVALSVLMLRFAGRIYRNSVLRTGARVSWRDAFRAA